MLTFVTMHLGFSAEETAFAEEVRAFLRRHPPGTFLPDGMDAGYGSGAVSRAFLKALGAEGYLRMAWPRRFGGEERPMALKLILLEELALVGAPFGPLSGADQTAEVIIRDGTPYLQSEVLPGSGAAK